ncbi:hypothetical protein ACHZ97_04320 [Lysobacter soli]|uniref:hypothetical protein n=1 Tax=Lysobacter soli TaxID=453783 RepID=UPI0037C9129C
MSITRTTLPNFPADLPSHVDVRDFALGDGRFARVIMELDTAAKNGHFHLKAQAYQMNADGTFAVAPLGYPSRSNQTEHTVIESALGDTQDLDDAWVRHTSTDIDPNALQLAVVTERPSEPGSEYGQLVWDSVRGHAWRWQEGFADSTALAKVQDLINVLNTSSVRSGLGFRRN